jgi:hypothetical protein
MRPFRFPLTGCLLRHPPLTNKRKWLHGAGVGLLLFTRLSASAPVEKIRNEKVRVVEQTLAPAETLSLAGEHPHVVVFLADGAASAQPGAVHRGDTSFLAAGEGVITNRGASPLPLVWIEFLGTGSSEMWGTTGLAPHYQLLGEDRYARVYDIRIPAETSEPLHSHHERVVVCLSGAELRHEMPDGRTETSSLRTGEIAWRPAATHVGHNLGQTALWVIAVEPK